MDGFEVYAQALRSAAGTLRGELPRVSGLLPTARAVGDADAGHAGVNRELDRLAGGLTRALQGLRGLLDGTAANLDRAAAFYQGADARARGGLHSISPRPPEGF